MNKEQKQEVIDTLKDKFSQYSNFYITNTESLTVAQVNKLRKHCFEKQVEMRVAKNTLIRKALESLDEEKYTGVYDSLHQVTALMFSESPKEPALIISSFRKANNNDRPVLKAAFLNGDVFVGDNQLVALTKIKTKNELIGEVIGLLMSPIQRVIGALQNRSEGEASSKEEAPAAEAVPAAQAKGDAPATDAPATDVTAADTKAAETKAAPPATETPVAETPKTEAPVGEVPASGTEVETSAADTEKPAGPTGETHDETKTTA